MNLMCPLPRRTHFGLTQYVAKYYLYFDHTVIFTGKKITIENTSDKYHCRAISGASKGKYSLLNEYPHPIYNENPIVCLTEKCCRYIIM